MPAPAAMVTGNNVRALISGIISSMAKTVAPSGALKAAASPAAAPAATRVRRCHCSSRIRRPKREDNAAPICTLAASSPTEPPVPLWIPAASDLKIADSERTSPSRL